ncbi:MAG: hypothetical protein JO274_10600 [Gammaproteobacteria bacterium]|nr:hypothetical protein [Gammaproteobacteria bacterium]
MSGRQALRAARRVRTIGRKVRRIGGGILHRYRPRQRKIGISSIDGFGYGLRRSYTAAAECDNRHPAPVAGADNISCRIFVSHASSNKSQAGHFSSICESG